MRQLIAYFIKHSVAVNVVVLAFLIFGLFGAYKLKSSFFPLADSKIISISITYPGASPQEIEEGIVLKIEDNLKGLNGVERVTSTSNENTGRITVEIEKGKAIDFMLLEVKNAVDRVPSFPAGMEPLIVAKQEALRPTITFAISGKNVSLKTLKTIGRQVENDLRAIEGISQIETTGYPEEEIEIAVNETRLLAYDLSFQDIANAVNQSSLIATGGTIKTSSEDYLIRANSRAYQANELSNLVLKADASGRIITLKEVATVSDRFSETPNANYFNGNRAINVTVTSTNTEDLISSADKVKAYMAVFNKTHDAIQLNVVRDRSITLVQRTALLTENAIIGMVLVLLFLSVFLNVRLAFWVAFGLPVAFLGMFMFAGYFNVTINVLSLFGMIIVIGILVDDGIVIAENIYQQYEKGKPAHKAAIDGVLEVLPAIISAILTTILAFSIFLFLDGRIGELFGEVSVVVLLTLVVSLVEALIILPAHLAHSKALQSKDSVIKSGWNGLFQRLSLKLRAINVVGDRIMVWLRDTLYSPVLRFALRYKFLTFSLFIAIFILTRASVLGGIIRGAFFPRIASDRVTITLNMPNGTNAKTTDSIIKDIEDKAIVVTNQMHMSYLGRDAKAHLVKNRIRRIGPGTSRAVLEINLLPGEDRPNAITAGLVTNKIRDYVGPVFGVESLIYGSGGNFGGQPLSVALLGNDIKALKAVKEELKHYLKNNSALKDVEDNDPDGLKEIRLQLKSNAYALGLNLRSVMAQVRAAFFGAQAQRFQRGQDEIKVWVRYSRSDRASLQNLEQMRILTPTGNRVPLQEIANYTIARGDVAINHLEGQREIQVSADIKNPKKTSATDVMAEIREQVMPEILSKYPTVTPSYEGQNRERLKLLKSLGPVGLVVIVLIYIVIAFTFRSYSQPLLLILLIPFSLPAVAWGHWLHGFSLNILSLLGIIALIGIMVNDGLVLISKFNANLRAGLAFDTALYEAGRSRFRAIFLTSITTVAGLAPLIFEKSRQAQFLIPMAVSIAYGIAFATVLTLLVLPLFLAFSNALKRNIKWLWTNRKVTKEEVERVVKEQQP